MSRRAVVVKQLAEKYYARVFSFARQLTDPVTAEDVTQEVFTRLLNVEDLENRPINISYLLKTAHNLVRGQHRRDVRAKKYLDTQATAQRSEACVEAKPQLSAEQLADVIDSAFQRLTRNEHDAVRLTVCCGLSLKEASESLGVRVSTITNWKYRGLRKLAQQPEGPVAA